MEKEGFKWTGQITLMPMFLAIYEGGGFSLNINTFRNYAKRITNKLVYIEVNIITSEDVS
jgi:hypothetical protein